MLHAVHALVVVVIPDGESGAPTSISEQSTIVLVPPHLMPAILHDCSPRTRTRPRPPSPAVRSTSHGHGPQPSTWPSAGRGPYPASRGISAVGRAGKRRMRICQLSCNLMLLSDRDESRRRRCTRARETSGRGSPVKGPWGCLSPLGPGCGASVRASVQSSWARVRRIVCARRIELLCVRPVSVTVSQLCPMSTALSLLAMEWGRKSST